MSKKDNKKNHEAAVASPGPIEAASSTMLDAAVGATAEKAAAPSEEEKKVSLKHAFARYEVLDEEINGLKTKLEEAVAARSVVIKSIAELAGTGPFRFKGDELTISSRNDSFFFRGKRKERSAIEID